MLMLLATKINAVPQKKAAKKIWLGLLALAIVK